MFLLETHLPNHILPTTYLPAAVTGGLRSLDQPVEAHLSIEGMGEVNVKYTEPKMGNGVRPPFT